MINRVIDWLGGEDISMNITWNDYEHDETVHTCKVDKICEDTFDKIGTLLQNGH